MNLKSTNGLTLFELVVELLVIVLALMGLSAALFPAGSNPLSANMTAVGVRGKDIFVALAAADAEREALGLASLWPRDAATGGVDRASAPAMPDFKTSTAYFAWLLGARDGDVPGWDPQAKGINYGKLAGAGVKPCLTNGCLTAENNLWIVAKNVHDDMDDIVPVLITRNVDASSLVARLEAHNLEKSLKFASTWKTPFGKKGCVMIRKGGAIFKVRDKYMTQRVVYQNQAFDTSSTPDGRVAPPLKYLTPDREVVPEP